jgi:hypothetical protein
MTLPPKFNKKESFYPSSSQHFRRSSYTNKKGNRVTQEMHRKSLWMTTGTRKKLFNELDGQIFKGVEEILKESLECETYGIRWQTNALQVQQDTSKEIKLHK